MKFYSLSNCSPQQSDKMKTMTSRLRSRYKTRCAAHLTRVSSKRFRSLMKLLLICVQDDNDVYILTKVSDVLHSIFSSYREQVLPWFEQLLQLIVNLIVSPLLMSWVLRVLLWRSPQHFRVTVSILKWNCYLNNYTFLSHQECFLMNYIEFQAPQNCSYPQPCALFWDQKQVFPF